VDDGSVVIGEGKVQYPPFMASRGATASSSPAAPPRPPCPVTAKTFAAPAGGGVGFLLASPKGEAGAWFLTTWRRAGWTGRGFSQTKAPPSPSRIVLGGHW